MKAIVLGDTHFGGSYSLGTTNSYRQLNSRLIDYANTFDRVIDHMKVEGIKHIIITGDIYEHRRPQAAEMSIFTEKLQRLREIGAHTHMVVGNHDIVRDQNATTLDMLKNLKIPNINIYKNVETVICSDGSEDVINFIFFPFRTRQMFKCAENIEAVNRLSSLLQYELSMLKQGYKILIGHFMIQETTLGQTVANSPMNEIALPVSMFKDLDGVIMGHVHGHEIIKTDPFVSYIGSMERNNFGDANDEKYFLEIDTNEGLCYTFKPLFTRPLYDIEIDMRNLKEDDPTEFCINYCTKFFEDNFPKDSIVRITVFVNSNIAHNLKKERLRRFIKSKIHHCVGIHVHIVSNRQLRKESINERCSPSSSFEDYLSLIKDEIMREKMREKGLEIISQRNQ